MNYQKSTIYVLEANEPDENGRHLKYVGSTTRSLSCRLSEHKRDYKRYLNGKYSYVTSFKIIETGDYDILILEEFPCDTKEELHDREAYWIRRIECVNKYIPSRSSKYWKKYQKEYYKDNKDVINAKRNIKNECECGGRYTNNHKAEHMRSKKHRQYLNPPTIKVHIELEIPNIPTATKTKKQVQPSE